MSERIYIAIAQHGQCKICGHFDDLRMGVCFDCADFAAGEQVSPTMHKLWDVRNPANIWFVQTAGIPKQDA